MRICRIKVGVGLVFVLSAWAFGQQAPTVQPGQKLAGFVGRVMSVIEPAKESPARTFSTRLTVTKGEGLPAELLNATLDVAYQAPDRVRLTVGYRGERYSLGRDGQQLWAYVPSKRFGVIGEPNVARFRGDLGDVDRTVLGPMSIPLGIKAQILAIPLMSQVEQVSGDAILVTPAKAVGELLGLGGVKVEMVFADAGVFPTRIRLRDGGRLDVEVKLEETREEAPWVAERWALKGGAEDRIERTAVSHLLRLLDVAAATMRERIPTLGPATGERVLIAREGEGRLERWDGTRVLFLKGTPEEMGRQHGLLLKSQVRAVTDRMLYGVGVGSSLAKGAWFFGEIEGAYKRLEPFMLPRHFAEIDAMATAAGISKYEMRLASFFPELFHCSGYSVFGEATVGGRMYHGRILDYLKGVGLEQNAVVMVMQPERGNAWVNIGYAGFVGSVTAMNEKHISIGEMGGRGEGDWDGKPMAQLVREVMEEANTLEEAVEIFRKGPRTCEYYYVISDGKTKRAVALECTPTKFVTVGPGEAHPRLAHPMKDTVLISAGSRYEELARRVKENYGKLDMEGARNLMLRPVAMSSNIQSVLFAPETLDFWVANADSKNAASHARYTHYNLGEMLKGGPAGVVSR